MFLSENVRAVFVMLDELSVVESKNTAYFPLGEVVRTNRKKDDLTT